MTPTQRFFVGMDSDGCVFESMELKQKNCFCPNFIRSFGLRAISGYARETWEFVNLYSRSRGCNRYQAVMRTLDLLRERPETKASAVVIPTMDGLRDWLRRETKLGILALRTEVERGGNADLELVYRWSLAVNEAIEKMARAVRPYPLVLESLEALRGKADAMVISQSPFEALKREWEKYGFDRLVRCIAGQELGAKTGHIALAARRKYPAANILMVGDAPGDLEAARENGALFYPINPGHEEDSWRRFHGEALGRFFEGSFAGAYESALVREFDGYLPELPHWRS
ncbi:MAG: haloacid dehalogenase [Spirochaetes bacterium GWB1_59_5]|nr:MAG: haloacid dehalogenase [Spirochaetes bacterium GWB1_59_5]